MKEKLPKVKLGQLFEWNGKVWRRGKGIIYVAHPADPTIRSAAYGRYLKRRARYRMNLWRIKHGLSPKPYVSRSRWGNEELIVRKSGW